MKINKLPGYLLYLTAVVWFSGLGGRDLYFLPFIFFLAGTLIQKQSVFELMKNAAVKLMDTKKLLWLFFATVFIASLTFILKYYSFSWHVHDVGIFSDILYNLTQGDYFSAYVNSHALADHFSVSFALLSFPYSLYPHVHWVTISKLVAYISCPVIGWQISRHCFKDSPLSLLGLYLGIAWLLIYPPSVKGFYFEFQPSSLSLPFVLGAFLFYLKRKWVLFFACMILLLGFKEHLGAVWIGFGLYMLLNERRDRLLGGILVIGGIAVIYTVMFEIMPYYRNYDPAWSQPIGIFNNIPHKLYYLLKLLAPMLFLPVIFWRQGIIAAPAIGVNLISGSEKMVSTIYHYDDIASVLLLIGLILIIRSNKKLLLFHKTLPGKIFITGGLLYIILFLPPAPLKYLYESIPNSADLDKAEEIKQLNITTDNSTVIYVQESLGTHFYRKNMRLIIDESCTTDKYSGKTIAVLDSKGSCLGNFETLAQWRKLPSKTLQIFERITP